MAALAQPNGLGRSVYDIAQANRAVSEKADVTVGAGADALRFEHLVASSTAGQPDSERLAALREALGLWRSSAPFADLIDTAYPAAEAARLVELRGTATEALIGPLASWKDALEDVVRRLE